MRVHVFGCIALSLLLASCKTPTPQATTVAVQGSTNVQVRGSNVYAADIGASASSQAYYIVCRVTFTNTLGHDVSPQAKNFVFYDALGQPYVGVDSGASWFVGVSNYAGVVKPDAKQDYTIGFRVPSPTSGSVYYAQD
ncbi:MAG: hypothetical protein JO060_09265 [Candidatus Eremiobacteraeota bacterium]|nr:hypothetical protein [Candidatus Eremiobacteraeota bacterium]MBV9647965.1 hypothetical protein [Candidatus Eremiobacteraeota bacterium]